MKSRTESEWFTIFNSLRYFNHHLGTSHGEYLVQKNASEEVEAVFCYSETDQGSFRSPKRGTFGGFEFSKQDVSLIRDFISYSLHRVQLSGASKLEIVCKPSDQSAKLCPITLNCLIQNGFNIKWSDINYSISLSQETLFESMDRGNKKRVKKCNRENFLFSDAKSRQEIESSYQVIADNRKQKNLVLNMTLEQIFQMKSLFPDDFFIFFCSQNGIKAAAAVCVRLNRDVMYVFAWGDNKSFSNYSPISFLADKIFIEARLLGCQVLDIGIATEFGKPNETLMKFKSHLGFSPFEKLTLEKKY